MGEKPKGTGVGGVTEQLLERFFLKISKGTGGIFVMSLKNNDSDSNFELKVEI